MSLSSEENFKHLPFEALSENEPVFEQILMNSPEAVSVADEKGDYLYVNQAMCEITGFQKEELLQKNVRDLVPPSQKLDLFYRVKEGQNGRRETPLLRKDGSLFIAEISGVPIRSHKNHYVVGFIRDVTEKRKAEVSLFESEEKYKSVVETLAEGIVIHDSSGAIIDANKSAESILGLTREQLLGKTSIDSDWKTIYPDGSEFPGEQHPAMKALKTGQKIDHQVMGVQSSRSLTWISVNARPLVDGASDTIYGSIASFNDITNRIHHEKELERMLKEKETLLRELYHRTKNNMNVVSSYLQLQMFHLDEDPMISVLTDIDSRIRSMALVHQKLYTSGNLSAINLREYIKDLLEVLQDSYFPEKKSIDLNLDCPDLEILIDLAIPIGLVLNEMVTNAFKHAFRKTTQGRILVRVREQGDWIEIDFCDNGPGISESFELEYAETVGLMTMRAIVIDQLKGSISYKNKPGLCWQIRCNTKLYNDRLNYEH